VSWFGNRLWKNVSPWGGNREPTPFIPEPGMYEAPVATPIGSPFARFLDTREPIMAKRRSPGHPGCADCRASKGGSYVAVSTEGDKTFAYAGQLPAGACERHRDYHHQTEALWGIGF
jgi:hypothetical protein